MMAQFRYALEPGPTRAIAKGWLAVVCTALVILLAPPGALAGTSAVDNLSDTPMFARVLPPPANIMFLLDDSGSMNFDVMVRGGYDGGFPNPELDVRGFCYVFDNLGDNIYSSGDYPSWYAGAEGRKLWQTQFYQTNAMYYNPSVTYLPWPSYGNTTFPNADPDKPRSHPVLSSNLKLDLQGTSFTIGTGASLVTVPHSHYFVFSAIRAAPYLVVIDKTTSKMKYYRATVTGTGLAAKVSVLTADTTPPADVVTGRTYSAERQNFANWFTYHRRREFVAKNALANIIKNMADVRVGIYGINKAIVAPLEPVNVTQGLSLTDNTNLLLDKLYQYSSCICGTPLKEGLDTVGKFFKSNTGTIGGISGPKPYGETGQGAACQQSFTVILTDGFYSDLGYTFGGGNADGDNGGPYADSLSNTLADIAMYYYENDLNALEDLVPTSKYDKAKHQHMATYAVAFGVSGKLNPADYDESFKKNGQLVQWPTSIPDRSPEGIDDLWHATVNGRGKFYNAANPQELTTSLNDLMNAIAEILIGSSSSVTVNGDYLYGKVGSNTFIYQGLYSNRDGEWAGDVKAYPVDAVTGDVLTQDPKVWSAAQKLETKDWDKRLIATFDGTKGVPFVEGKLSDAQKTALGSDLGNKVKYLRGGTVSSYRIRSQKLGDIVNSAPVFLDDVIYAGANDGMLHAFDASTGAEIFAYVPNLVFDNLNLLTEPAYTHRFYVDLTPTVKKGKGILDAAATDTLLVGGLRKGGKGYFGLKVTDSKSVTTETELVNRVLWEFSETSDPEKGYMGYSFSKPVVVKSNSTAHPWVVIFGNGYNSKNGNSALYIIDAKTGDLIKRIDAGAGPDNGLSTPIAVDPTHDDQVDFVYAGDLKGNLWKFDLSQNNIANWKVAFSKGGVAQPLFQAKGPGGTVQPITTRPDVMYHPEQHGFIVCFGTGKYLGDSDTDPSDPSVQSVYGIWDYGDSVYDLRTQKWSVDDDTEFLGAFERSSAKKLSNQPDKVSLLEQTQQGYQKYRFLSSLKPIWLTQNDQTSGQEPNPSDAAVNHAGYYFDLGPGERVISDVIIRNKLLLAIGFTPNNDRCGPGGNSMFMEINAFTGGTAGGSLFDINGDLKIDANDLVNVNINGTRENLAPSGLEFFGNIQPPAILGLPGSDQHEKKYLSSSTGKIELLHEKGQKLGVAYWMEVHY
jgi:type IV pilus assembly protein PilY1